MNREAPILKFDYFTPISVVAFKTLDISQGSVTTDLRCGGICSDSVISNFFLTDSEMILNG